MNRTLNAKLNRPWNPRLQDNTFKIYKELYNIENPKPAKPKNKSEKTQLRKLHKDLNLNHSGSEAVAVSRFRSHSQ